MTPIPEAPATPRDRFDAVSAEIEELHARARALPWYAVNQRKLLTDEMLRKVNGEMMPALADGIRESFLVARLFPPNPQP